MPMPEAQTSKPVRLLDLEQAAEAFKRRLLAQIERERVARAAAGDHREIYILCPARNLQKITPDRLAA
jgi:hypothetical protein